MSCSGYRHQAATVLRGLGQQIRSRRKVSSVPSRPTRVLSIIRTLSAGHTGQVPNGHALFCGTESFSYLFLLSSNPKAEVLGGQNLREILFVRARSRNLTIVPSTNHRISFTTPILTARKLQLQVYMDTDDCDICRSNARSSAEIGPPCLGAVYIRTCKR